MKKKYLGMAIALTLAGSMMFSSCIGSFRLSNKLMSWNQTIGSKFVNELVFLRSGFFLYMKYPALRICWC